MSKQIRIPERTIPETVAELSSVMVLPDKRLIVQTLDGQTFEIALTSTQFNQVITFVTNAVQAVYPLALASVEDVPEPE
jgi:hypothetical protein